MTLPTLPVSGVVNVGIEMSPVASPNRNFGATLIVGASNVIDTDTRIRSYSASELSDIAREFGSTSPEYLASVAFFGQSPQPRDVTIGRWAKTATSGILKGAILATPSQEIALFTRITSGAFDVTIDGTVVNITGVNLSAESNLNGVASQVTVNMKGKGSCVWTGERFVLTSATTGVESKVSNVTDTDLSQVLGLNTGTVAVTGSPSESLVDAMTALLDFPNWYSAVLACDYTDEEVLAVAQTIEAASPSRILAVTLTDSAELDPNQITSLGHKLKESNLQRTFTVYSSTSRYVAASVLGRMSTVNFEGSNTTITLKFKQCPSITAENLRTSQASALKKNNVNVFVKYDNDTQILQEGTMCGGWFIDERHGLDWIQNYVQNAIWNLLYSSKKVGQDESGSTTLVTTVSNAIEQGVRNGLVAPGTWTSDGFGVLERGDYLSTGYYVYITPLDEQSQADREARKAPPIQVAIKLKGAVHFVDVMINVNR